MALLMQERSCGQDAVPSKSPPQREARSELWASSICTVKVKTYTYKIVSYIFKLTSSERISRLNASHPSFIFILAVALLE